MLNPEVVIWNALPLSFVADWIFPVGAFLEARAFASSLKGTFVTSTRREFNASNLHFVNVPSAFYHVSLTMNADKIAFERWGSLDRVVSGSLEVPLPSVTPLGMLKSWQRATTAVALVVGLSTGNLPIRHTR
jgi:hypothetical protein